VRIFKNTRFARFAAKEGVTDGELRKTVSRLEAGYEKYKSEIYETVHQDATEMFKIGGISEAEMREFDEMCLAEEPVTAYEAEDTVSVEHVTA